jgi:demethylmenaquinone methyltransferase/2-methoxy-6-polyprenyl-1,4-benzoquinol methylase
MLDWDQLAPAYGRQLWLERSAIRSLLDLLDVRSDERLLDLATGPATVLAQLARRPTRPAVAVGIDSSEAMISRASPLPAAWRLQIADATRLPFADHSFDVLTASFLLHVLAPAKRQAVIAESARVLRSGGRLGVVTIAPPRGRLERAITAPARSVVSRASGRLIGLRPLDPRPELEAAGFSALVARRSFRGYASLCVTASWGL